MIAGGGEGGALFFPQQLSAHSANNDKITLPEVYHTHRIASMLAGVYLSRQRILPVRPIILCLPPP